MTHEMDIWHDSFVKIKEQTKTIEMRLFDEKRSLISTGDTIIFTDTSLSLIHISEPTRH